MASTLTTRRVYAGGSPQSDAKAEGGEMGTSIDDAQMLTIISADPLSCLVYGDYSP